MVKGPEEQKLEEIKEEEEEKKDKQEDNTTTTSISKTSSEFTYSKILNGKNYQQKKKKLQIFENRI